MKTMVTYHSTSAWTVTGLVRINSGLYFEIFSVFIDKDKYVVAKCKMKEIIKMTDASPGHAILTHII